LIAKAVGIQKAYPMREIILIFSNNNLDYIIGGLALALKHTLSLKMILLNPPPHAFDVDYAKVANVLGFMADASHSFIHWMTPLKNCFNIMDWLY